MAYTPKQQAELRKRQQAKHVVAPKAATKTPAPTKRAPVSAPPAPTQQQLEAKFSATRAATKTATKKAAAPAASATTPTAASTDPASVTAPLTPQQLDAQTKAAVDLKYGTQETDNQGQQRVSDQEQSNITNWFQDYQNAVAAGRQASAAYDAGAQAAMNAQAQNAQTQDNAAASTITNPALQAESTQAASARRSTSDSYGAMLAAQGSAHNQSLVDKGVIGAGEAANQHVQESGRKATLAQQLQDLHGQAADYGTQYRATAVDTERKNDQADAAFDLNQTTETDNTATKAATITQDAKDKKAARTVSRKNTKDKIAATQEKDAATQAAKGSAINKYGYTADDWAALSTSARQKVIKDFGASGGKGVTTAERNHVDSIRGKSNAALTRLNKAQGLWDSLNGSRITTGAVDANGHAVTDPKTGQPQTRAVTPADIRAELAKDGYSPNEIHLMLLVRAGKKWGPQEIVMAHQLGIRVPRNYIAKPGTTSSKPVKPKTPAALTGPLTPPAFSGA